MQKRHVAKVVVPPADAGGRKQPIEKEEKKGILRANKKPQGVDCGFTSADLRHKPVPFNAYEVS
jgi:hypothetical protein